MDDGAAKGRRTRISSGGAELARLALAATFAVAPPQPAVPLAAAPQPAPPEPAVPQPDTLQPAAPRPDALQPAALQPATLRPAAPGPAPARSVPAPRALVLARAQDLCVTEGEVRTPGANRLAVDSTKMRAFLNRATGQSVEARFKYLGGTVRESPLGSGAVRRQFGLKLEAQDACNLLYAMWRIEPEAKLVVSVKTNPGEHSSAECGNRGYRNLKPARSAPVPSLRPGDAHALRAELSGTSMRVLIDGRPVWEGDVGAEALRLAGPVGLRSDNVRLELELRTAAPLPGAPGESKACPSGGAESACEGTCEWACEGRVRGDVRVGVRPAVRGDCDRPCEGTCEGACEEPCNGRMQGARATGAHAAEAERETSDRCLGLLFTPQIKSITWTNLIG